MPGHAIVSGGSIGGLFAAAALRARGWTVEVFERSEVELSGRGAGIVTHAPLVAALDAVGAGTADLGVAVEERVAFGLNGERIATLRLPQVVTSWDRIHGLLRAITPEGSHHLNRHVTGYAEHPGGVAVHLADGRRFEADLLVGADGFRSAIRGQMQPEVQPVYSGYVVWRALAHEAALSDHLRQTVFPHFGFFAPAGTQIIGYPIAGPGNDLRPGHRRYNFVWYGQVAEAGDNAELAGMLTDASGHRHEISIPPPLIRDDILARMRADAERRLPRPFVEILDQSERPFFTPIYDHHAPIFGAGRVALSGDAACVARPHVGMGVTKAATDALELAEALAREADIPAALAAYSRLRAPAALKAMERARQLGRYIFRADQATDPDGRANPHLEEVMATTATVVA